MRYRVVDKADFFLIGRRARVPLVHEGLNPGIVDFVRSIDPDTLQRLAALSDQEPFGILNVSDNLTGSRHEGEELDYWHGVVTTAETPADLDVLSVPAGMWAVFESFGAFPQTPQYLWRDVFVEWFPLNPYRSRPGPEMSRTRLSPSGADASAELWIPVQPTMG